MEIPPEYRRAAGWKTGRQRPEKLLPRERGGPKAPCAMSAHEQRLLSPCGQAKARR